ncbi:hypothetical protein NNC19_16225 [Clostridium sp. SHJSY1]|uniref:hypothetical protein n=1 Tax=Clostridium sp. SHJSY1 TaxID=2942483 RepID=UPI002876E3F3|nr:hypothetical protein [Clostridium sp. SHJSY1]MDS0527238.1 hypothetical protein [Clostridium sp. SHJSY1]
MFYSEKFAEKVLNGYVITKDDALKLYFQPKEELFISANKLREKICGDKANATISGSLLTTYSNEGTCSDRKLLRNLGLSVKELNEITF